MKNSIAVYGVFGIPFVKTDQQAQVVQAARSRNCTNCN